MRSGLLSGEGGADRRDPPGEGATTGQLVAACLVGWACTTNYTNHAALVPVLMEDLGFGPTRAGLLSTAFFLALAATFFPAGLLSDRFGPRRVAALALLLTFASNLALAGAGGFGGLVVIKLAGGVGAGAAFIAGMRHVTLVFPPGRVHRALGLYGGFVQLGGGSALYLLPALHGLWGWRWAFAASSLPVLGALAVWVAVARDARAAPAPAAIAAALGSATVWRLGLVHGATFGLAIVVGSWVTTFLVHDLGQDLAAAGAAGSLVLAAGVVSRPAGGLVIERGWLSPAWAMRGSILVGGVSLAALAHPDRPVWIAVLAIVAIGLALSLPYSAVMNAAAAALPQAPGGAIGLASSISLLALALGAPAVGALFARTASFTPPFVLLAALCLLTLAAVPRSAGR